MNLVKHAAALSGTTFALVTAWTPADWAQVAAIFSGAACGVFYTVKAAAVLKEKFFTPKK